MTSPLRLDLDRGLKSEPEDSKVHEESVIAELDSVLNSYHSNSSGTKSSGTGKSNMNLSLSNVLTLDVYFCRQEKEKQRRAWQR